MVTQEMINFLHDLITSNTRKRMQLTNPTGNLEEYATCGAFVAKFKVNIWEIINFTEYPNYSGHAMHPVPSPLHDISAHAMYMKALMNNTLWDFRTKYGKNRKDFVKWCISELDKLL